MKTWILWSACSSKFAVRMCSIAVMHPHSFEVHHFLASNTHSTSPLPSPCGILCIMALYMLLVAQVLDHADHHMDQGAVGPASPTAQLLDLPSLPLETVLRQLSSVDKLSALMLASKQSRKAALLHEPILRFELKDAPPGSQLGAELIELLATRLQPVHIKLWVIQMQHSVPATLLLIKLAYQRYPDSFGFGCVHELTLDVDSWVGLQLQKCVYALNLNDTHCDSSRQLTEAFACSVLLPRRIHYHVLQPDLLLAA